MGKANNIRMHQDLLLQGRAANQLSDHVNIIQLISNTE